MAFNEKLQSLYKRLGTHSIMVLSTEGEGRISSRQMSVVICKGKFYFQTDKSYLKCRQLSVNPRAALSVNNYSIEGKCKFIGRPLDKENSFFISLFKKYFYISYKAYSHLPNEVLIEFSPNLVYSWNYEFTKPYMEYWDLCSGNYRKEYK